MIKRIIFRLAIFGLGAVILTSLVSAVATSNTVPGTHVGRSTRPIDANALKPSQCAALNLTAVVVCTGGNCNGTSASELIIGTSGSDTIRSKGGTDCILGGGGGDDITGGGAGDVCLGGPGTDTFSKCETVYQDGP